MIPWTGCSGERHGDSGDEGRGVWADRGGGCDGDDYSGQMNWYFKIKCRSFVPNCFKNT